MTGGLAQGHVSPEVRDQLKDEVLLSQGPFCCREPLDFHISVIIPMFTREPRAESREPGAGSREPGAESREPGAESREPGAESREPRAESREPRAESREPRAESREPRAESREPGAGLTLQPTCGCIVNTCPFRFV
ncbi:hypothetical protein EYF80_019769 [Liparis tanakae]|uniref:Uncharacterized protein n=1 Tax=Liparis tanakae TaxID=230148 RepID=A0A4Z2HYN8_9TELE|nr:hypothetical protein EYF80_019769 [Liparis tanakae]